MSHDLHSHTTASDGVLSPRDLVRRARKKGLRSLAVTDHDTVAGVFEAAEEGSKCGLEVIAGIEISSVVGDKNVHILGYFADPARSDLAAFQDERRRERRERLFQIMARLREVEIDLTEEDVFDGVDERCTVGRPHIARALVRRGHVENVREAFDRLLGPDCPGYVDCPRLTAAEAVALVAARGGVTSVAHPGIDGLEGSLPELRESGVLGLEVFHSSHGPEQVRHFFELAERLDMLPTGGSDFHSGNAGEGAELGLVTLPEEHFRRFADTLHGTRTS